MNLTNRVRSDRKSDRLERKKRKLVAHANAAKLNEKMARKKEDASLATVSNDQRVDVCHYNDNRNDSDEMLASTTDVTNGTAVAVDTHPNVMAEPILKKHKLMTTTIRFANDRSPDADDIEKKYEMCANTQRNLTDEEYAVLKKELRERKIFLTRIPRIRVNDDGEKATLETSLDKRIPLFVKDIQHMLVYLLFGPYLKPFTSSPRWCCIEKFTRIQTITLTVIEGVSSNDFVANRHNLPSLESLFTIKVDVVTPSSYEGDIVTDIVAISMIDNDRNSLLAKFGHDTNGVRKNNEKVFRMFESNAMNMPSTLNDGGGGGGSGGESLRLQMNAKNEESAKSTKRTFVSDNIPRTSLLLSLWQMAVENYPVPIRGELYERYSSYRKTKQTYRQVHDSSPLFAIDCEMCTTIANENELTRITIVNEQSQIVYESLVKPRNKIINYLTKYSGITEDMLRHVTKRLEHVQNDLIDLLPPDAILVGHSLNTDLHALKMMHPYVIDTSVIYNLSGERWRKPKLQTLAWQFLGVKIQENAKGHDSAEDSLSSLKLVQLKLSQSISYGDVTLEGKQYLPTDVNIQPIEKTEHTTATATATLATSLFDNLSRANKPSTIIGNEKNIAKYRKFVTRRTNVNDDNQGYKMDDNTFCNFINASSAKSILRHSLNAIDDKSKFVLIHASVDEKTDKEKFLARLDNWYSQLWQRSVDNSAHVMLFTGSTNDYSNAVCMVEIKKPFVASRKSRLD